MPDRILLMLHGLGGDEHTMGPVGKRCRRRLDDTRFVAVEAPLNFGNDLDPVLGWFAAPGDANRAIDGPDPPKLHGIENSVAMVHEMIRGLVDEIGHATSIHLLGHSQGGAVALAAGLTYPARLGSVCTIAGYLALTPEMAPVATGTKYFLHHSQHDDNVTVRWAHYAQAYMDNLGESCQLRIWDIQRDSHAMHPRQLDAICTEIANAKDL